MKSIDVERWRKAQIHEKDFHIAGTTKGQPHAEIWTKYVRLLGSHTIMNETSKTLDVGCGPRGARAYHDRVSLVDGDSPGEVAEAVSKAAGAEFEGGCRLMSRRDATIRLVREVYLPSLKRLRLG